MDSVESPDAVLRDLRGRPLTDLRISVTDRCNFRCTYCMPRDVFGADHAFLPRSEILSYSELERLVGVFARLGVTKIRLTGGEPLLRRDFATLVRAVAATPGIADVAMTSNGSLLAEHAAPLAAAGLTRVTVSLDSLDPDIFRAMADTRVPLSAVLAGIDAARDAGLGPVKLNAVVRRGVNDDGLLDLVGYARDGGHVLRFIEFMDVGSTNGWDSTEVVPAAELIARVGAAFPLEPLAARVPGETARRWAFADGRGELGVVASVTAPFCSDCSRARVTAAGELFTCLFATQGTDLRSVLRGGPADGDAELERVLRGVWGRRTDRYSELRAAGLPTPGVRKEMSYLGG